MTFLELTDRYVAIVLRRPWLVVALATAVMVAMTAGARFIAVTNDYRLMFGADNPELAAFDALENTFSESNRAVIAIAPGEGSVFTRETLGAIEELTEAAWRAPYSSRVDSLTNYSHSEAFEDDLTVAPLVEDAQSLSDADLARIEAIALNSIETAGRLVSVDGRVGGLVINFFLPDELDVAVVEITDYLNAVLDEARASNADIGYYLTGDVVMNRAFADATQDDLRRLMPIVFMVIVAVAAILLRSVLGTLAIVAVVLFVINTTMGLAGWLGTAFSPTNAGVPIIVMAVTVAYTVHIVAMALLRLSQGLDRKAAIAESLRHNLNPVFLTTLTTAIGFLSLNASDSPPFHVLGNLVAFGVFCAFVYSMTLLPALLSILPLRATAIRSDRPLVFDRLASFVIANRTRLLWSIGLVAVVLVMGIPRNELSDNWTRYFDDRYQYRRDTDFYRLPEDPELAAQYLLLYEFSLPFGNDLNDRINVSKSATRMTVVVDSLSGQELRALDTRAEAWLNANQRDIATTASGISMVFAHLSQRNIESMLRGTIIAMSLISLILILVFRSVRMGLISLLPNFIPAAMSFGLWGYLVGRVGFASSVVTVVAFGIIVDDTIHFLTRYLQARKEGLPAPEAVRSTFRTVGQALTTTTLVLSAGFLVFTASGFEISWALGILVTITIVIALLTDFLLLPTLLMAIDRGK